MWVDPAVAHDTPLAINIAPWAIAVTPAYFPFMSLTGQFIYCTRWYAQVGFRPGYALRTRVAPAIAHVTPPKVYLVDIAVDFPLFSR